MYTKEWLCGADGFLTQSEAEGTHWRITKDYIYCTSKEVLQSVLAWWGRTKFYRYYIDHKDVKHNMDAERVSYEEVDSAGPNFEFTDIAWDGHTQHSNIYIKIRKDIK